MVSSRELVSSFLSLSLSFYSSLLSLPNRKIIKCGLRDREREGEGESVSNGRLFLNVEKLMYEKSVAVGRARAQGKGEGRRRGYVV